MPETLKTAARRVLLPLVRALRAAGVHPDQVTAAGVVAALIAAGFLSAGRTGLAVVWLLISLLCDLLDGDLARLRGTGASRFGAFFDSCCDRLSEALVFGGLMIGKVYHGAGVTWPWIAVWVLCLTGGFLVSYARARAEGLGLECRIGIGDRFARMALLLIMLVAGYRASFWFLVVLSVLSWITVFQRAALVWRGTRPPVTAASAYAATSAARADGKRS